MVTKSRIEMTLGEAIEAEKLRLKIKSNRTFAKKAGVSPQLINDLINESPRKLDIISLKKISDFTGLSLVSLLKLAFPDAVSLDLDIETRLDAERIHNMPPNKKALTRGYIFGEYVKGDDK